MASENKLHQRGDRTFSHRVARGAIQLAICELQEAAKNDSHSYIITFDDCIWTLNGRAEVSIKIEDPAVRLDTGPGIAFYSVKFLLDFSAYWNKKAEWSWAPIRMTCMKALVAALQAARLPIPRGYEEYAPSA